MTNRDILKKEIRYAESQGFKPIIRESMNGVLTTVSLQVTDTGGGAVIFQYQEGKRIMRTFISLDDIACLNRAIVEEMDKQERECIDTTSPTGVLN